MRQYEPALISFLCKRIPTDGLRDPALPRRFQYGPIEVVTPSATIKELIANELAGRARA